MRKDPRSSDCMDGYRCIEPQKKKCVRSSGAPADVVKQGTQVVPTCYIDTTTSIIVLLSRSLSLLLFLRLLPVNHGFAYGCQQCASTHRSCETNRARPPVSSTAILQCTQRIVAGTLGSKTRVSKSAGGVKWLANSAIFQKTFLAAYSNRYRYLRCGATCCFRCGVRRQSITHHLAPTYATLDWMTMEITRWTRAQGTLHSSGCPWAWVARHRTPPVIHTGTYRAFDTHEKKYMQHTSRVVDVLPSKHGKGQRR